MHNWKEKENLLNYVGEEMFDFIDSSIPLPLEIKKEGDKIFNSEFVKNISKFLYSKNTKLELWKIEYLIEEYYWHTHKLFLSSNRINILFNK